MALTDPLQLISIAVILLVLFLWGPKKIPEMARMLGRARKEFESASKEFQQVTQELQNPTALLDRISTTPPSEQQTSVQSQPALPPTASSPSVNEGKSADEILISTARELGILTQGKTREQISQEIVSKAKSGNQVQPTQQQQQS